MIPAKRSLTTSDFFIGAGLWKKKNVPREQREFAFGAKTDDERDEWITAINLLRTRAVHRGFESKFGRINLLEPAPPRKDPRPRIEQQQVLSFKTPSRRESVSSGEPLRKSTGFRGKLLRSATNLFKTASAEETPVDAKLKANFSSLIGYFLSDALISIAENVTQGGRATKVGSFKPIVSGDALSRDSLLDSEFSLPSSQGGQA